MFNNGRPTILITGATSGIGQVTAELMVNSGCQVIVHGRDEKKVLALCEKISAPDNVIPVWGDLSDLLQVRILANQISAITPFINGMIFNAGVFQTGGLLSNDGLELDFSVNYLSHFLLFHLLFEKSNPTFRTRVVFVSSSAYISGKIDFDQFGTQYVNDPMMAYSTSKLLCLMGAIEIAKRVSKTNTSVNIYNPGPIRTSLLDTGKNYGWAVSGQSPNKAAKQLKWLMLDEELESVSGSYFNGCRRPNVPARIRDPKQTSKVYESSIDLCKLDPL